MNKEQQEAARLCGVGAAANNPTGDVDKLAVVYFSESKLDMGHWAEFKRLFIEGFTGK